MSDLEITASQSFLESQEDPETLHISKDEDAPLADLKSIIGRQPPSSDKAYRLYCSLSPCEKQRAKLAAQAFVKRINCAINFDDALVWLACFDFDPAAMDAAIAKWLREQDAV